MKIHNSCDFCQNRHVFELDKDLFDAFLGGNVAIFAGAGISTESKMVLNYSFYDEISNELNNNSGLSFPELMQEYCKTKTNGRYNLIQKIKKRFDHIHSFPELETRASEFHKALSTLFFQKTIITTNWDTYFEDFCSAVPFVTDKDLAFWESSERKVLKIHGSINNLEEIGDRPQ
jgi:NAD-dependent SIR2 family protein deacetylase